MGTSHDNTGSALHELESKLREIDELIDDTERFLQENALFHQMICRHAGTTLMESVESLAWLHWDRLRCRYRTAVLAHQARVAQQEHWELLKAVRAADADKVEQISRRHNRRTQEAYQRQMEGQSVQPRSAFEHPFCSSTGSALPPPSTRCTGVSCERSGRFALTVDNRAHGLQPAFLGW